MTHCPGTDAVQGGGKRIAADILPTEVNKAATPSKIGVVERAQRYGMVLPPIADQVAACHTSDA